jgi:hypothetical protein
MHDLRSPAIGDEIPQLILATRLPSAIAEVVQKNRLQRLLSWADDLLQAVSVTLVSNVSNVQSFIWQISRQTNFVAFRDDNTSKRAAVEEIWSSWRYEKLVSPPVPILAPKPAKLAERVNQLMRLREYDQALQMTLSEVEREEQGRVRRVDAHPMVPWYDWEAAAIYRKLKRYDEEAALIRRFAHNHDIHLRALSKRNRSTSGGSEAWAARFLERLETANALAAGQIDDKSRWDDRGGAPHR